jgi:hypothetical protein
MSSAGARLNDEVGQGGARRAEVVYKEQPTKKAFRFRKAFHYSPKNFLVHLHQLAAVNFAIDSKFYNKHSGLVA